MTVTEMRVEPSAIDGLFVIQMKQVTDERGTVHELYRESAWHTAGLPSLGRWVQVNVTESKRGAIRGLHGEGMYKLVAIPAGEALGVYVDTRATSPTFKTVVTVRLTPGQQVLVPEGVCNGFQSLSAEPTQYLYCFDHEWVAGMAGAAVNPLDPSLGIEWPLPVDVGDRTAISAKDAALPPLGESG